jgi:2-keto-3-deoxy-L-rhamnonate aldolase RhmA
MKLATELRERVTAGPQPAIGTFILEFASPAVVGAMARAGMEFCMIDAEHGAFDISQICRLIEASQQARICTIVRVPGAERGLITQVLDAGAGGVLLAQVRSMDQVRALVDVTKYAPMGARGVHMLRPHTNFDPPRDAAQFMQQANRSLLTGVLVETREALDMIDAIAAVDGVDFLYVGPGDLSVSLGSPFNLPNSQLMEIVSTVSDACRRHGKLCGCHAGSIGQMSSLRDIGCHLIGFAAEMRLFMQGVTHFMNGVREELNASPKSSVCATTLIAREAVSAARAASPTP